MKEEEERKEVEVRGGVSEEKGRGNEKKRRISITARRLDCLALSEEQNYHLNEILSNGFTSVETS